MRPLCPPETSSYFRSRRDGPKVQELARRATVKKRKLTEAVEQLVAEGGHHLVDAEGMAGLELRPVDEGVIDEMVEVGIVNEKDYDESE